MKRPKRDEPGKGVPSAFESPEGDEVIRRAFAGHTSNLAAYLFGKHKGYLRYLSVRLRKDKDYIAIATRFNEATFDFEVAFGTGVTLIAALVSLDKSIAKNAWKLDKYRSFA